MSAVSAESPRGSADLTKSSANSTQATAEPPSSRPSGRADFGPNQWLVDELYQRYLADPGSVDQAWWSFFADYQAAAGLRRPRPQSTAPAVPAGDTRGRAPAGHRARGETRPAQPAAVRQPGAGAGTARRPAPAGTARRPGTAPASTASGQPHASASTAPASTAATGPAPAAPVSTAPGERCPGTQPPAPRPRLRARPDEHAERLRGAAARTAANMAASLTVPTATSVRPVPG